MGDIDVDFFQETLKQLIKSSKVRSIMREKHRLESLEEEIKYMRGFLKVTEKKRNKRPEVMNLVRKIKDVVSEAENIIESFVVQAFKAKLAPYFLRQHPDDISLDLESVKKNIKTLTAEIKQIFDENMYDINGVVASKELEHSFFKSEGDSSSSGGSNTSKRAEEKVVVGFEEEVETLMEELHDTGENRGPEIISIIGAAGGGKTTLAREVYDHPRTLQTFEIRAWVNVSQEYDKTMKRDLLIHILEAASSNKHGDYEKTSEDKLGEQTFKCLKGKKYLIVMDDMWDIEAWNDIQRSFPKECNGSKVMFTSRLVIKSNSIRYVPHFLAPLAKSYSWELVQNKVFKNKCCPLELVDIGKQIAEKCEGLPLTIVIIAGILAVKDKTLDVWEEVAKHFSLIIAKSQDGRMEMLELSYDRLPLHLKACLVYIGGFQDSEILVRELIWLWIAEGFIQQSEGDKSLEDVAKEYLSSLIDRNLVIVARERSFGGIKACHINGLLREFCLKKAEEENFLVQIYGDNTLSPFAATKHRRLFIGSQFFHKFSLRPCTRNLHSFMFLRLENPPCPLFELNLSFFVKNFEFLRVLSFISPECRGKIGRGHLIHLRYMALQLPNDASYFVSPFSYLFNLETINLQAPSDNFGWKTIPLPRDIFKMVKLRHLYAKRVVFEYHHSCLYPDIAAQIGFDRSSMLDSLQTLHPICPCVQCQNFLVRTPNLRKLGFYGDLISNDFVLMLPDLEFLKCLETLSFHQCGIAEGATTLPPGLKFPANVTRITLKGTHIMWEELSILQTLPSLEVLKLLEQACQGPIWVTSEVEEGFPQLKYLRLQDLDIKEWNASEGQFPRLEVLVVNHCTHLKQIPIEFANVNELCKIEVIRCSRSVEESAREIQTERRYVRGDDGCINLWVTSNYF